MKDSRWQVEKQSRSPRQRALATTERVRLRAAQMKRKREKTDRDGAQREKKRRMSGFHLITTATWGGYCAFISCRGPAFKPEFNIMELNVPHGGRPYTQSCSDKKKSPPLKLPLSSVQRLRAHRETSYKREKALCSDSIQTSPPAGFDRFWWHPQESSHAFHLISLVTIFPNWPVSLHKECIQETDMINTVKNVNMSVLGVAIKAPLHSSMKVYGSD